MRIAYVYYNSLEKKTANVNQSLNMICSLSESAQVYFFSNHISRKKLKRQLDFYSLKKNFIHKNIFSFYFDKNKYLEFLFRFIYNFQVLILFRFFSYFDVIYTRDFSFIYLVSLAPFFLRPRQKIIYEPHTIYHISSKKVSLQQEKRALSVVDYFFPISQGLKNDLASFFELNDKLMTVLPDGVNLKNFCSVDVDEKYLQKRYGFSDDDFVVVYSGSFKSWKGVDILVKSIKYLNIKSLKFLLVGGGVKKKEIEKLIDSEKVGGRVVVDYFLPQRDVVQILKSSDIAVLPNTITPIGSIYTSPLKLFEYMSCSLPIVASNLPALREVLIEGENCLFFESGNEMDLAQKINTLFFDSKTRELMTTNNTKKSKDFDWNKRSEKVLNILNIILDVKP